MELQEHPLKTILKKIEQLTANFKKIKQDTVIYLQSQAGILITFDNANQQKMMSLKVWGNGYGSKPFETIINLYHYTPTGTFLRSYQKNIAGSLSVCSAGIIDNKCVIWIPKIENYTTYVIETILSADSTAINNHTAMLLTEKPEIEYEIKLSIVN